MHRSALGFCAAALLSLAGCTGEDGHDAPRAAPTQSANIGSVTFDYDPQVLSLSDIELPLPPDGTVRTFAIKLVPAREIEKGADDMCGDEEGEARPCTLADEPGITLALLEQPFETYSEAWRAANPGSELRPVEIDGAEGLALAGGIEEGLEVDYTIVPVEDRALLIKRQSDGESPAEEAAIAAVLGSLELPG